MPANFEEKLHKLLKTIPAYLDQDGGLNKAAVINDAYKCNITLCKLLSDDEDARKKFFFKNKNDYFLNIADFVAYIQDKNFLNDSYTKFKNKIGLNVGGKFLNERKEVSLVWPFKDCVLEGGMTKEDEKRKEIFFNEILAQDEIDKLFKPKVLTNWKRFTKKGEEKVGTLARASDPEGTQASNGAGGTIRENFIIKGNNLLALHTLKEQFQGKVKLIYIDPPYNTGTDSFGYNDSFNHSSWLTFMKNRLEVAKTLLKDEGVIFVQCDSREQAYLKVLMDEIFDRENFIEVITVVNNPRGRDYGGVANMHEFINVYAKSTEYELYRLEEKDKEFPHSDNLGGFEIRELRNRNIAFNDKNRPNLVYSFYVNPKVTDKNGFYEIGLEKKTGWIEVMPAKSQGIQTVWRWGKEKSAKELNKNICGKEMQNGGWQIVEKYREKSTMARSVWWDKAVNSERGTLHIKELFNGKVFDHPKPEETLWRIIEMATREGDIVLDFFAGTGTTGAVALKTKRQFILCEQMDYIEKLTTKRLEKAIEGEKGGISETVGWKGGGDFIYCELMKYNEEFIDEIKNAGDTKNLLKIWEEMKKRAFFNYSIDLQEFEKSISEFKQFSIDRQKHLLVSLLNKNQLYVNLSEIDDKDFKVGKEDKEMNKEFYGK